MAAPLLDEEADPGDAAADSATAAAPGSGTEPGPASVATWLPAEPLPAVRGNGPVDIVLSPHPDDETLSLGVWIADRVHAGHRVIVVALTDGRSTGATPKVAARLGQPVTRDQIAAARIREMRAAVAELGVLPTDVYLAHLDGDLTPGGTRATVPEVSAVLDAFAARFPFATFATMSDLAEHHPDHLNAGRALMAAWAGGRVRAAVFAISRLYWRAPVRGEYAVSATVPEVRRRVEAAARAYEVWDPAAGRLAVGWASVHSQFEALVADPVNHFHPPQDATGYPTVTPAIGTLPR